MTDNFASADEGDAARDPDFVLAVKRWEDALDQVAIRRFSSGVRAAVFALAFVGIVSCGYVAHRVMGGPSPDTLAGAPFGAPDLFGSRDAGSVALIFLLTLGFCAVLTIRASDEARRSRDLADERLVADLASVSPSGAGPGIFPKNPAGIVRALANRREAGFRQSC